MGLLDRIDARLNGRDEQRYSIDTWINDFLIPGSFNYSGNTYYYGGLPQLTQTLAGNRAAEVAATLPGYTAALLRCPPAFAAQMVRALVICQARFVFRTLPFASPKPWRDGTREERAHVGTRIFGTKELTILERPWPRATSTELISRMEWHAGLAGNAYVVRQPARNGNPERLRVLRPDWVAVIWGSESDPNSEYAGYMMDGEKLGYAYFPGGISVGKPEIILADEAAHWAPIPDPLSPGMGMSWITPAIRDIQSDGVMTDHKIRYFENGASPNLIIKNLPAATKEQFDAIVDMLEERHSGSSNAFKTLYLTGGADATVVGGNMGEVDFKQVQGASETRIAFLARVPAPILGIAEGLAGSSLNAGNFGQARRIFADTWVYPTLHDLANCLAAIVPVPASAELWFETDDIPLLREDAKDAADIVSVNTESIRRMVDSGFDPESAVLAVESGDLSLLRHTGFLSVQLQKQPTPGMQPASPVSNGNGRAR